MDSHDGGGGGGDGGRDEGIERRARRALISSARFPAVRGPRASHPPPSSLPLLSLSLVHSRVPCLTILKPGMNQTDE